MNNKKNILLMLTLTVTCAFYLTACGSPSNITGTWKITGWKLNDKIHYLKDYKLNTDAMIKFTTDNKVTIKYGNNAFTGTWKQAGETIKITVNGKTSECSIEDGKLLFGDKNSGFAIYEKQKE